MFEELAEKFCTKCNLSKDCHTPQMLPIGAEDAEIYVLGEGPSDRDDLMGKPFSGDSGRIFKMLLENAKINPEKVRFNNAVNCKIKGTEGPSDLQINECRDKIFADIKKTKPKVIIAMGDASLKSIFNRSEPGIFGWRGWQIPSHEFNCWVVPTFSMRTILKDGIPEDDKYIIKGTNHTDTLRVLREDLTIILDLLSVPIPKIRPYKIEKLLKFDQVKEFFIMAYKQPFFTFDYETIGLKPYLPESCILSCSFSFDGETAYTMPISYFDYITKKKYWDEKQEEFIINNLRQLLIKKESKKIAHNSVFEMEWSKALLDIDIENIGDSMLQKYILDGREGTKGLDFLTFVNFGISHKIYPNYIMQNLTQLPIEELLEYNGKDSIFEYRIYKLQEKQIGKEKLQEVYEEQLETAKTIAQIQFDGAYTNEESRLKLLEDYRNTAKEIELELLSLDSVQEFKKRFTKVPALKSNSKDIPTILFKIENLDSSKKTKKGNFSVDKEVLMQYSEKSKFCELLLKYREYSGLESKILKSWTECVFPDKKYHTNFYPVSTGRLGSSNPNLQNLNKRKHPEIRQIIIAPQDHVLLIWDYAQLEARVIAAVSNCRKFIEMIKSGYDIHMEKAIEIWGEETIKNATIKEVKLMRYNAKNGFVFPTIYGSMPKSTAKRLNISESHAEFIYNKLWSDFPEIKEWQDSVLKFYDKKRYVEIPPGRRRYAPLSRNEILNTPIQGSSSSIVCKVMNILSRRKYHIMMNVHDELVFCVKEKEAKYAAEEIQSIMETKQYDFMIDVPLVVEGSIGLNWYETISIKEVL